MKHLFVGGPVHLKYIEADGERPTMIRTDHVFALMAEDPEFRKGEDFYTRTEPVLYRPQRVRPQRGMEFIVYIHPSIRTDSHFNDLIFAPRGGPTVKAQSSHGSGVLPPKG